MKYRANVTITYPDREIVWHDVVFRASNTLTREGLEEGFAKVAKANLKTAGVYSVTILEEM